MQLSSKQLQNTYPSRLSSINRTAPASAQAKHQNQLGIVKTQTFDLQIIAEWTSQHELTLNPKKL